MIIFICVFTDIGGYIFGNFFKGPKLTKLSPKKTYSGVIGGYLFSIIFMTLFFNYADIISEITNIPRPTVVRKLKYLINNDYLSINKKKLITVNIRGKAFEASTNLQNKNMVNFSNFIFRLFNQIKIINPH